jgi:predicted ester cyclase
LLSTGKVEEQNKELVRRCMVEFDKKNLDIIDELYASDYKMDSPAVADPISREQNKKMAHAFYKAFPDMTNTIDRLIAEGDIVARQYTIRVTHKGEFSVIPPTDNKVIVTIMGIWRFADGK